MGGILSSSSKQAANMSGPVADFVRKSIASDKIVIFSKSYCPYCTTAKEVNWSSSQNGRATFWLFAVFPYFVAIQEVKQKVHRHRDWGPQRLSGDSRCSRWNDGSTECKCNDVSLTAGLLMTSFQVPRVFIDGKFIGGKSVFSWWFRYLFREMVKC